MEKGEEYQDQPSMSGLRAVASCLPVELTNATVMGHTPPRMLLCQLTCAATTKCIAEFEEVV